MKRTSPVVHPPPKPAKVPHYSSESTGQNIVSGNNLNERQPPHFLPSQFAQQPQSTPNNTQTFPAPASSSSSSEPPLMSPEISSGPTSTDHNSKNDEGMFNLNSKIVL